MAQLVPTAPSTLRNPKSAHFAVKKAGIYLGIQNKESWSQLAINAGVNITKHALIVAKIEKLSQQTVMGKEYVKLATKELNLTSALNVD